MADKIRIQNLIFTESLSIRVEHRECLTKKRNSIFGLIVVMTRGKEGVKNENKHQHVDGFLLAASNIEKSNEFLEDYYKIVSGNDNL